MSPTTLKRVGRPVLDALVRRALRRPRPDGSPASGRMTREDANLVLRRLWERFDRLAPDIPPAPTFGSRMNLGLAAVTVAAYRSLLEAGVGREEAIGLIAEVAWRVYRTWGLIPRAIATVLTTDPLGRLRIATGLFRRFPFNPPGYLMEDVPAAGAVAFDVRRCPVSDYFRSQGLEALCVGTWCALDGPLARLWGGRLERQGTLAGGADLCDFRWIPGRAPSGRAERAGRGAEGGGHP